MILSICGKVVDTGVYTLYDGDNQVTEDVQDYVPDFIDGTEHFGDYLEFDIDIETGQILNWHVNKAALRKWAKKHAI